MTHSQSELDEMARDVLAENPDLPILVLSNDAGGDWEWYYHFVTHASVEDVVFPAELEERYGSTFGLDPERWYDDLEEASDEVEGWLWYFGHGPEYQRANGPHNGYLEWVKVYGPIAEMIVDDMPKHKYVVVRAEL